MLAVRYRDHLFPYGSTSGFNNMDDDLNQVSLDGEASEAAPAPSHHVTVVAVSNGWLRPIRWLQALMAALLWLTLVYGLPLQTLRESRRIAKDELARLLQTGKPDTPAVMDAFDRATEQVLFSVAGPYFILGVSMLFLVAHLVTIKRRLDAAERNIRTLRDVVLGVDGVPLR